MGSGDGASGPGGADCAVLRWSTRLETAGCLLRADTNRTRRFRIYRPCFAVDIWVSVLAPAGRPPALVEP